MKILIFDTETSGLPISDLDPLDFRQPWVLQLGAVIVNEAFEIEHQLNTLIKVPERVIFNPEAVKVHGLTKALVMQEGRDTKEAYEEFRQMVESVDIVSAYNLPFDDRIMTTSGLRIDRDHYTTNPMIPEEAHKLCIMQSTEAIVGRRMRLSGAYYYFTRQRIKNCHDAFADTLAAREVLKGIFEHTANHINRNRHKISS